ncbi:Uma2 family endonuclease [Zavarzinella formosa]|uniref:Uma2 family endonuclease n=1 Tax=Zavarzinella formosa TaxID=360055 RepID=UPI0002F8E2A3|nr:Uma2 family endonuclease [Zavarzinella formosa]
MISGHMTVDEFQSWRDLPENQDRKCELHLGKIVDVPLAGELYGIVSAIVGYRLMSYSLLHGRGTVFGKSAGLVTSDDTVLGPNLMMIGERVGRKDLSKGFCRRVPLLCVELLSSCNDLTIMMRRVIQYLKLGVFLIWVIDSDDQAVIEFSLSGQMRVLDESDTLTGNGILPDFSCPVADLFRLPGTA